MPGIIGTKIGMTSIFGKEGENIACTVIQAGPCVVTQVKNVETDGYRAVQLSFGDKKEKHSNKAEQGHFKKANTAPKKAIVEFRDFRAEFEGKVELGAQLFAQDVFVEGDFVDAVGTSKGKGFQGVVKRHGFSGVGESTHGQHNRLRAPGSLGNASFASRVQKGKRIVSLITRFDRQRLRRLGATSDEPVYLFLNVDERLLHDESRVGCDML